MRTVQDALRYKVHSVKAAVKEMAYSLEQPECNIPNDYSEETKDARWEAAEKIYYFVGMIIAYGALSVTLWAATVFFAAFAVYDSGDFSLMLFVAILMFVMALSLTILDIAYIKDLPEALLYNEDAESVMNEAKTRSAEISEETDDR